MRPELIVFIISILILIFLLYCFIRFPSKSKSARKLRLSIFALVAVTALVSGFINFTPRGNNPMSALAGEGDEKGSDIRQTYSDGREYDGPEDVFIIVMSGNMASVNDDNFEIKGGDDSGFSQFLFTRDLEGIEVMLVDDYAFSGAYTYVRDALEKSGAVVVEDRIP